ncbi:MAG: hypothetical protein Q9171_006572 [Xanthocarpia ochracea]
MRHAAQRFWLTLSILTILLASFSQALPHASRVRQPSVGRSTKRDFLVRRDDDAFLGDEWTVARMENDAAYVPHEQAAVALTDFYLSLLPLSGSIITQPTHWLIHRLGRVEIIFHCTGMTITWEIIFRFAERMLEFTRRGYTSSYLMQFRHVNLGFVLTVTLSIMDHEPEDTGNCILENNGQINESGTQHHPVCMWPPSFPNPGQGSGPSS